MMVKSGSNPGRGVTETQFRTWSLKKTALVSLLPLSFLIWNPVCGSILNLKDTFASQAQTVHVSSALVCLEGLTGGASQQAEPD